jgi:chromosome segregation protein
MYLKRLEIQGFKSFAHKSTLHFEPGITAIVGPNGSGKSNVADAIRWVMGEQSMKLLRGKKSEDVIFAGSDKKSKLSLAEVGLLFDNRDRKLPFEYPEVEIRRRLYRNGESEYLVNNQKVRLFDITDALIRSGFGTSNYAVIGQGMIDQMILAGPAEIKNLIEEASGVKPYYLKREKTIRRLSKTEENLTQANQLINEIEPRLRSLKRQAKRMEEREAVALELKELNLEYFGSQYATLKTELGAVSQNFELKQKVISELEGQVSAFQKTLEKEEQESKSSSNFSYELSKKTSVLEQRRFKLKEELAEIRGKIKSGLIPGQIDRESLKLQRLEIERELESLTSQLKQLDRQLSSNSDNLASLKDQLSKLGQKIERSKNRTIDISLWQQELVNFQKEFTFVLNTFDAVNWKDSVSKLKGLVDKLVESSRLKELNHEDLESLQAKKEIIISELHQMELRVVEQKTLKGRFLEDIESKTLKLNQVKSLLKDSGDSFEHELINQERSLSQQLEEVVKQTEESKKALEELSSKDIERKNFLVEEEKKYRKQARQVADLKDEQSAVLVERARIETRIEGLVKEASEHGIDEEGLRQHSKIEIAPDLANRISRLKHQLELAGGIDEQVLSEYRETEERYNYLKTQSDDLSRAMADLKQVIDELDDIIKTQFDHGFKSISEKFSEYFRILFNGGRAHMNLLKEMVSGEEGPEDSGEEAALDKEDKHARGSKQVVGIEIRATPPGKKLATIAALSGGERALTSIALLCAMLASNPSPFVVLDEVDAALDEANSIRFAGILGTLSHNTQFITVTHNRETMRRSHTLYGVTMSDEGISKVLSIKLEEAVKDVKNKHQ